MSKAQQSHSGMSTMGLNHSADSAPPMSPMEYPPTSQMMPSTPQAHAHPNAGMMYPHYAPVPQSKQKIFIVACIHTCTRLYDLVHCQDSKSAIDGQLPSNQSYKQKMFIVTCIHTRLYDLVHCQDSKSAIDGQLPSNQSYKQKMFIVTCIHTRLYDIVHCQNSRVLLMANCLATKVFFIGKLPVMTKGVGHHRVGQ